MQTTGLDVIGEDGVFGDEGVYGDEIVGVDRAAQLQHALARRGGMFRMPSALQGASPQGVSRPKEDLDPLPFTRLTMTTVGSGFLEALPQRPFRGERLVMFATYVPAAGTPFDVGGSVVISPAFYVGAVQIGATQGDTPVAFYAPTAFGVRLAWPAAGQGSRIYIPIVSLIPIAAGDSIIVTATCSGRAVR